MPSIKDNMGADLSRYRAIEAPKLPVVAQMINDNKPRANVFIRCPLPPFNSDPDTLRQFETGNQVPQRRVIPLPVMATVGTSQVSLAGSAFVISSSSSSSPAAPTQLLPLSASLSTGGLATGDNFQGSVQMSKSFQLLSLSANEVCEVRLYGTSSAQSFDAGRAEGDPVPPEISQNIISCVTFDSLPYNWPWQNKIGANQDTPQSLTVYVTVFNTDVSAVTNIDIAIGYLPLEA